MLQALLAPPSADADGIAARVQPGAHIGAADCLAIYRRSYVLRLRRCLAEQFPATRYALGEALFDDFADTYLRDCPSVSTTLYDLGRRYAQWLEDNRPDRDSPAAEREDWIDFLVDLAGYERELFQLFDAPGNEGQAWPDAGVGDDELVLQSCLTLVQYRYPVAWYYHEVRAGHAPAFPVRGDAALVLVRRDYHTTTYPVNGLHYRFLTQLRQGAPIGAALQDIAAWTGRSLDAVTQSWRADVRQLWLEAGFFLQRSAAADHAPESRIATVPAADHRD